MAWTTRAISRSQLSNVRRRPCLGAHCCVLRICGRIGVLMSTAADHSESKARLAAFLQRLQDLGWVDGRNARIDVRWPGSNFARFRSDGAELAALAPDVILATGTSGLSPLLTVTRTVPIVFVAIADPVGGGFVESLARPGGNATGFTVSNMLLAQNGWSCSSRSRPA